jgi:Predicted permease.
MIMKWQAMEISLISNILALRFVHTLYAWINYVNLSTAHSLDRSKEVGIRKVVGAGKFQLVRQFLTESFFLNIIAIILGILVFRLTLPAFSTLVEKDLDSLVLLIGDFGYS